MDNNIQPNYDEAYQSIYGELSERGMSTKAMSGILKGNKYSSKQLFDMSKKSTKEGRHGEAQAMYKEFQRKKSQKEEVEVGKHRREYEKFKQELKEHHIEKYNNWVKKLQEEGYDVTKWESKELIETYIKENDLYNSKETIYEALGDGYPARIEGPQKGLGNALCPTCGQMGCIKDHSEDKEEEVQEGWGAVAKGAVVAAKKVASTKVGKAAISAGAESAASAAGERIANIGKKKEKVEEGSDWRKELAWEGYQRNPEEGERKEREANKKYERVRGERTPMPPRGNKRREDFEKWYAANVR